MFRDSLKLRANAPEQIGKINFFCGKWHLFTFGKLLIWGG